MLVAIFSLVLNLAAEKAHGAVALQTMTMKGRIALKPWNEQRDDKVIKQQLDYSCGAASLATILHGFYGLDISESDILETAGKDAWFSFADMAQILPRFGYKGVGLALTLRQLQEIKIPAIVFLRTRAGPHFAVLRGISDDMIWLADPVSGNQRYPTDTFSRLWETGSNDERVGTIFLVLPQTNSADSVTNEGFFGQPEPWSEVSIKMLRNAQRTPYR